VKQGLPGRGFVALEIVLPLTEALKDQVIEGVIFDLFGTLIENLRRPAFEAMLAEMALVLSAPAEGFKENWENSWEKRSVGFFPSLEEDLQNICRSMNAQPGISNIRRAADIGRDFTRNLLLNPRPGGLRTLTGLKESGYRTGLISNCATTVPPVWPDSPMATLIDAPVFSCTVHLRKPDVRVYQLACGKLGLPPGQCLYVADGNQGELTGATGAGLHPVLFSGPDEDPYDEGKDRREWRGQTISSLEEVLSILS